MSSFLVLNSVNLRSCLLMCAHSNVNLCEWRPVLFALSFASHNMLPQSDTIRWNKSHACRSVLKGVFSCVHMVKWNCVHPCASDMLRGARGCVHLCRLWLCEECQTVWGKTQGKKKHRRPLVKLNIAVSTQKKVAQMRVWAFWSAILLSRLDFGSLTVRGLCYKRF